MRKDLILLLTVIPAMSCSAKKYSPNVLMFCIDDLRPQLGCYGHNETVSPNIDKLASKGVLFTNAHCNVPVCGASRASLLTGIRPNPKRFTTAASWASQDAKGAKSLPQVFKEAGYYTLSNGKVFHHKEDLNEESWTETAWQPNRDQGAYFIPGNDTLKNPRFGWGPWYEAAEMPDDAYFDGMVAEKTMDDLARLKETGKPFFLACGFYKPHLPLNAPKKYFDIYDPEEIVLADNLERPEDAPTSLMDSSEPSLFYLGDVKYNSTEYHKLTRKAYYACVSFVDSLVGRVMNRLKELELDDNTIIVLWGDHGWNLGEHSFWGKHNLMQNATQIPFIISAPGCKKGVKAATMAEFVDLFPTLTDLAEIDVTSIKDQLMGKSLKPALKNPKKVVQEEIYVRFRNGDKIVTPRYALTVYEVKNGTEEMLFDHQSDPDENINVAEKKDYAGIKATLKTKLDAMKIKVSH